MEKNAAASRLDTVDDESRPMKIDEDDENASSDEHETVLEQKQFNSHSARFHSESDSDSETEENSIDLTGYTNDDNDDQSNDRSDDDE